MSEASILWIIGSLFSLVVLLVGRYEYISRKAQDDRFAIANKIHDDRLLDLAAHQERLEERIQRMEQSVQSMHDRYEDKLQDSLNDREHLKTGVIWAMDTLNDVAASLGLKLSSRPKI